MIFYIFWASVYSVATHPGLYANVMAGSCATDGFDVQFNSVLNAKVFLSGNEFKIFEISSIFLNFSAF